MHGILQLKSGNDFTTNENARHEFQKVIPRSISSVVRGYKIGVTKWYLNDGGGSGVVGGAGVTGGSDGGVGGPHGPNDDSGGSGRKFSAPTLPDPDVKSNVPSQIIPHANTPHYAAPHPIPHLATQFL